MREWGLAIEGGLLIGCVWALLAIALAVMAVRVARAWSIWRRKRARVAIGALAMVAAIVGGTKPLVPLITWDDGLYNNGSYIDTNDLRRVELRWTFEEWIPNVATFTLSAIEKDTPNPDPSQDRLFVVGSCPISDRSMSVVMEREATNYLFFAEQSFIPDAPVVTNGVYHVQCVGGTNVWIPVGLRIYDGERSISPPSESFINNLMKGNLQ